MTKQEILDGLEGLKDMVNNNGKVQIDALKAGVTGLLEPEPLREIEPEPVAEEKALDPEPIVAPKKERTKPKPYKRRSK